MCLLGPSLAAALLDGLFEHPVHGSSIVQGVRGRRDMGRSDFHLVSLGPLLVPESPATSKKNGLATPSQSDSDEVNVPSFDVRAHEFHSHIVSDIEAARARHHFPFDRRLKEPDPRAPV
jgi:hypothetical protein